MRFRVKALRGGEVAVVDFDASTEADASRLARAQGLSVMSVRADGRIHARLLQPRRRFPLLLFAQELTSLLDAGLTTLEALEALARKEGGTKGTVLRAVLEHVHAGRNLSFAFEQSAAEFPPLFVATVRASERTGDLREALTRYVDYHSQIEHLRKKVVSASIYPALLALTGLIVTAFLLVYVVPRFSQIYEDIGGNLPFLSQLLMRWGQLLSNHALPTLGVLAALAVAAAAIGTRPRVRAGLAQALWKLPRLGEMLKVYQLARFYRTMGMLLRSGMPLVTSLAMAGGLLPPALRVALENARRQVQEGLPVSAAMERNALTTPVALSMLRVGERTGQLGAMMDRVANFLDDELARWVDIATRLFEPLLMALIGVVIGVIVVLLYLPVFELANSLQ